VLGLRAVDFIIQESACRRFRRGGALMIQRRKMTVTLFIPCFVDLLFPRAGISVVRILEKLGHKIEYPQELNCCGQRSTPVTGTSPARWPRRCCDA
jgi:Fe-S oxidoreductase